MALSSMTGFARGHGVAATYAWAWELKSVNAKGLDLRLRLPPGWDAIEAPARARVSEALTRGTVYGNLTIEQQGLAPSVRINEPVLDAVLAIITRLRATTGAPVPNVEGILALKGVLEIGEQDERDDERGIVEAALVAGFVQTLGELVSARREEGFALGRILSARLDEVASLAARAEAAPGRQPQAIKARLAEQVATLLSTGERFDADRLHQEAILLATKADIREELDRLAAHVAQARKLVTDGGAIGRRLDFLSQELNRESNTLCAKANDLELSNIGLELKTVIEQFREQVQNLE
ncbi:MAG: YicC/YloC family endoribonuclease [Pseudolabrys sp.]